MDEIGLKETKKMTKVAALTRGYLANPSVERNIEDCAKSISTPLPIDMKGGIHRMMLNWLTLIDYALQQNDFIAWRQEEPGQWLLDSTEFQYWLKIDR